MYQRSHGNIALISKASIDPIQVLTQSNIEFTEYKFSQNIIPRFLSNLSLKITWSWNQISFGFMIILLDHEIQKNICQICDVNALFERNWKRELEI